MNQSPEEFEKLRTLLTLKRHEQPPPGYFNQLPGEITARIEAGESAPGFWSSLILALTIKPAYATACALFLCGAIGTGTYYSFRSSGGQPASQQMAVQPVKKTTEQPAIAAQPASINPNVVPIAFANTNPVTEPKVPTLFDRSTQQPIVPASYQR